MSILSSFWQKICEPLDGFLWRKNISHPIARPMLRDQILLSGASLLAGATIYVIWPWLFWFACGLVCMCWIFWSWARFFLKLSGDLSNTPVISVLLRFGIRLVALAILLYVALAICAAPAGAILAGLVTGSITGLISYAHQARQL